MATYLTTLSKVKTVIDLSVRLPENRFRHFLRQVQDFDLLPLMRRKGLEAFYHDILRNVDDDSKPEYRKLIDGENYTDEDGYDRAFQGLVKCLAHWFWARYLVEGQMRDTGFDVVQKSSDWSEPVSSVLRKEARGRHYDQAVAYWYEVEKYLEVKAAGDTFTVYQDCSCGPGSPHEPGGMKSDIV